MELFQPANGAHLPLAHPLVFSGSAGPTIVRVKLIADKKFPVGETAVVAGRWTVARQFAGGGARQITIQGVDTAGAVLQSVDITVNLMESHTFGYTPPTGTGAHLGAIAFELEIAERVSPNLAGLEAMFVLPDGQFYFESDLDLDTDGEPDPGIIYDADHQDETSLRFPDGRSLNANKVPFFVLPGPAPHGTVTVGGVKVKLGDIAAVLYKDKLEFAILADTGPSAKIGEGSTALHRSLGFERVKPNKHILDSGIDRDVVTLVFPGSGDGTPQTPEKIREKGRKLFTALGGKVA